MNAQTGISTVHLIGVGGAGMSVVAELLHARGCTVSGSDQNPSSVIDRLQAAGIDAYVGHDADRVPADAIVVVSTAVRSTNPELVRATERGQSVIHRSQALAYAASGMRFVAVAGAHGKTTTSAMLTIALAEAGEDPSCAVGGIVPQFGTGAHLGGGDIFVAEADESDGSFLNYHPTVALVTNVEPDHLDHYGSTEAFEQAFVDFAHRIVAGGTLVCCAEDRGARALAQAARRDGITTLTYGRPEHCEAVPDVTITDVATTDHGSSAHLCGPDTLEATIRLAVVGDHNVLNAAGVWAAGCALGVDAGRLANGLSHFSSTGRRFELRGQVGSRRVIDDYAHHPTEVEAALRQARIVADGGEVTVVFQPHLFSRTRAFAQRFADALAHADHVVVTDIYPAREDPIEGVDSGLIVAHLPGAQWIPDMHEAARLAARQTGEHGIVMTMGAGSITQCADDVLDEWRNGDVQ